ncbi:hypothetical protein ACIA5G_14985 [Amycolatopsis sp. NPDC051758]|uniref:hypothetical protein n=1 Tax=Amycolatopsis sp. NPDC051758 TaxID=3363935 RepID=UPI0037942108
MAVRIHLDLDKLHLVVDGRRHRAGLTHVPAPGEVVVMFCGLADSVTYTTVPEQLVQTCWPCDLQYRHNLGFAIPPTHPGSATRPGAKSEGVRRDQTTKDT